jgi:hypothetical protein
VTSRLAPIIRALSSILFTPIAFLAFITISTAVGCVIWLLTGEPAGVAVRPSEVAGIWTGTLQEGCSGLRLVMHVTANSAGKLGVSLDSVDQRAWGVPMDKVVVKGKLFSFHNPSPDGTYQATLSADGSTLNGTWSEDTALPLVFTRTTAAAAPTQEPTPRPMPALAFGGLNAKTQSACGVPSAGADGWKVGAPESVGLSSATLCPMVKWLDHWKQADAHAVLIVRHNELVFEHYFTGCDEYSGLTAEQVAFNPETKHDERSVTKSVTALVLGVAIDRGWVKGVDQPVFSFFPEYADLRSPEENQITLRDLLTMSSGLDWHESDVPYTSAKNSEIPMNTSPDPYRFALMQPMAALPGKIWNYSSGRQRASRSTNWRALCCSNRSASLMSSGTRLRKTCPAPPAACVCGHETSPKLVS